MSYNCHCQCKCIKKNCEEPNFTVLPQELYKTESEEELKSVGHFTERSLAILTISYVGMFCLFASVLIYNNLVGK